MVGAFNMNLKMIVAQMMHHAEKYQAIPLDQYDPKNHRAINACLKKCIMLDHWQQCHQSGAIAMNDAEGCYNKRAHPIGISAMQRLEVSRETTTSIYGTLQRAVHSISTALGISDPQYGTIGQSPPVQGEGQGSGKGPATWVAMSPVLIKMMYTAQHGVQMVLALTRSSIRFVCFCFADNIDTAHTGKKVDTSMECFVEEFQQSMDQWTGGL